MKKLEGKIIVVTGGNSGIGLATAKLLRHEGAKVAISGRDQDTLSSAKKEIGGDTLASRSDVANAADVDAFFSKIGASLGKSMCYSPMLALRNSRRSATHRNRCLTKYSTSTSRVSS
jgi:NAD(P)-dependent dehydrogenase (short-subunit alcohol dehydrogenase family)